MPTTVEPPDGALATARGDRRALVTASGLICVLFAFGAAAQSVWVYGAALPGRDGAPFVPRLAANVVGLGLNLVVLVALRTQARRGNWARAGAAAASAVVAAGLRVAAQTLFGMSEVSTPATRVTEFVSGFAVAMAANLLGLGFLTSRQRIHHQARAAAEGELQYRWALQALQREEIRVRRDVAEGLHGSLQQHLVLLTARIDALSDRLAGGPVTPADLTELREISGTLSQIRESDVREISRMIYPDAIEVGLVPAVRSMLVRLPTTIGTHLEVTDAVRRLDDPASPLLTQGERLLAARIVEEGITNALRHGAAATIDVRLAVVGPALRIRVSDDGVGFALEDVAASGTARLTERLALVGGRLALTSVPGNGALLEAFLPVTANVSTVTGVDAVAPIG